MNHRIPCRAIQYLVAVVVLLYATPALTDQPTQAEMECAHALTQLPYPDAPPNIVVLPVDDVAGLAMLAGHSPHTRGLYYKGGLIILAEGSPWSLKIHEIAHHFGADEMKAQWVQRAVERGWCHE